MIRCGFWCCAVVLAGGCALAPKPGGASATPGALLQAGSGRVEYVNPFEPQRVRVHGLTGLSVVNGEPRIDAHLELFDAYGQPVKALGTCVFQLYASTGASGDLGQQLRRWVVDLTDPATNAAAYDRVTRTYRIALTEAPPPEATRGYVLEVQFQSIAGGSITTRHKL
ncbi:MAG: hypothetical protein KDA20_08165 [Phycisphaerales bacterium]|nr:hypothetical protein [Phycisphaerales bacterium]